MDSFTTELISVGDTNIVRVKQSILHHQLELIALFGHLS